MTTTSLDPLVKSPAPAPASEAGEVRGVYSITEAAALVGVNRVTIWRWIRAGRLPVVRSGRATYIAHTDLERLVLERIATQVGSRVSRSWLARTLEADFVAEPRRDGDSEPAQHIVRFYESDEALSAAVASFIEPALRDGSAAIVVATPAHRAEIERRLAAAGLDMDAVRADGSYVALDASRTLASFMADGVPDPQRFVEVMGGIIAQAVSSGRQVRIFGEMVALLVYEGNHAAVVQLEALWNDLQKSHAFSLFCAYPMTSLGGAPLADLLDDLCAQHTHVIPAESYMDLQNADDRLRAIVALQQRARWLEVEIAERMRVVSELRQREQELNDFFDNAAEGLNWVGPDGIILRANRAELEMLGYSADEYIGHHIAEFHADPDVIESILTRLGSGETLRDEHARLRCKDGSIKHVLINSNVRWQDGKFIHARCFTRDITERYQMESVLREAAQARDRALAETQAALRMRDEVLGSISHDLRTPLGTIKGYTQLLLRQSGRSPSLESESVTPMLSTVDSAVRKMAAMIDEVLDLTRLNAGQSLELNLEPTDLVALARQAVGEFERGAPTHQLAIVTDQPTLVGNWDSSRLDRVLSNLLSNAIKYSPDGGSVTVTLLREEADAGARAVVCVQDSGVGIPSADIPHIFDRFHRGANVVGRTGGVGIGLAGCKHNVELHDGSIEVVSREGEGTTVIVRLPIDGPNSDDRGSGPVDAS